MFTTKVFKSGNSLAVRIPKQLNLHQGDEVEVIKQGEVIILREPKRNLGEALRALPKCSDDFFAQGRNDSPPQERDFFE